MLSEMILRRIQFESNSSELKKLRKKIALYRLIKTHLRLRLRTFTYIQGDFICFGPG